MIDSLPLSAPVYLGRYGRHIKRFLVGGLAWNYGRENLSCFWQEVMEFLWNSFSDRLLAITTKAKGRDPSPCLSFPPPETASRG